MSKTELSELQHQCRLFKWADENCPIARQYMYGINNGGFRRGKEAAILIHSGTKRGVPDIHLPYPHGGYHGLFIELKKNKKAHKRPDQKKWIHRLTEQGYKAVFAYGWEEARDVVLNYLKKLTPHEEIK